jgi:hypothetical protein
MVFISILLDATGEQLLLALGLETNAARGGLIAATIVLVLITIRLTGVSVWTALALGLAFFVACIIAVPTAPVSLFVLLVAMVLWLAYMIATPPTWKR